MALNPRQKLFTGLISLNSLLSPFITNAQELSKEAQYFLWMCNSGTSCIPLVKIDEDIERINRALSKNLFYATIDKLGNNNGHVPGTADDGGKEQGYGVIGLINGYQEVLDKIFGNNNGTPDDFEAERFDKVFGQNLAFMELKHYVSTFPENIELGNFKGLPEREGLPERVRKQVLSNRNLPLHKQHYHKVQRR